MCIRDSDLLENFGGHTYAAGLSMKVEKVEEFTRRFETYVTEHILPEQTSAVSVKNNPMQGLQLLHGKCFLRKRSRTFYL